jgi:hypothetical protein
MSDISSVHDFQRFQGFSMGKYPRENMAICPSRMERPEVPISPTLEMFTFPNSFDLFIHSCPSVWGDWIFGETSSLIENMHSEFSNIDLHFKKVIEISGLTLKH